MDKKALVYKGLPPDHTCCDQALRILADGDWVVLFMTGGAVEPEKANYVALCRSSDEGCTWGPAETVLRLDDQACLLSEAFVHEDRLTLFVQTHDGGFGNWRNFTMSSMDCGRTWGKPAVFTPLPRRAFLRNLYVASWGEWILPFQSYDTEDDPGPSPLSDGSFRNPVNGTLVSSDAGASWESSNGIAGRCWAENNVVELSDGSLVMLVRADGTGCLFRSVSRNRARTWSEPVPTDIPNPGSKFRLFRLSDGRIVLLHNPNPAITHPNSKRQAACNRNPLALWVSEDDMESWGHQRVLTDFPGHLAYPDGVVDPDERYVHLAFDYNRHDVIYWGAELPPPSSLSGPQQSGRECLGPGPPVSPDDDKPAPSGKDTE